MRILTHVEALSVVRHMSLSPGDLATVLSQYTLS